VRARDNPFTAQRVLAVRYRLSGTTWDELLARLETLRFRAALVGPHGHGKTTLLEDLGVRLAERGFRVRTVTLHQGDRRLDGAQRRTLFHALTGEDVLFLDGAEQLSRLSWSEVRARTRAAGGLLITSHHSGLLPTLHECRTTPELLAGIVAELTGVGMETGELFERHGGNVREALRELYDVCALTSPVSALGPFGIQNGQDLSSEHRQIPFDHSPHLVQVDSKVVMNQNVAHPHDQGPGDLGVSRAKVFG
jgi:hypothetical protein